MSRTSQRLTRPLPPQDQAALVADMSRLVRRALGGRIRQRDAHGNDGADHTALYVECAREPLAPARMAALLRGSPAARRQTRELCERCLGHYRTVVRPNDAARGIDDVGAVVARFVAVGMHVVRSGGATPPVRITSKMLLRLERQLSAFVHEASAWSSAPAVDRQFYFEQLAILSVLLVETSRFASAQGPAAVADVQRAARGYLQQLLGIEPDLLTLGPDGLTLAGDDAADGGPRSALN
jgi:hypothetical protein